MTRDLISRRRDTKQCCLICLYNLKYFLTKSWIQWKVTHFFPRHYDKSNPFRSCTSGHSIFNAWKVLKNCHSHLPVSSILASSKHCVVASTNTLMLQNPCWNPAPVDRWPLETHLWFIRISYEMMQHCYAQSHVWSLNRRIWDLFCRRRALDPAPASFEEDESQDPTSTAAILVSF